MKRISPVLFLTLASTISLSGQTSFAQSQSTDMAPGPIAELLPKNDVPAATGFGYLDSAPGANRLPAPNRQSPQVDSARNQLPETNALPPATSRESSIVQPPAGNSLPLFDTPAQPRSTAALINSVPPKMPSAALTLPRTPGSFYPGSTPVADSQIGTGHEIVYSGIPFAGQTIAAPTLAAQPCDCQSAVVVSEGDFGCDTCAEGEIVSTGECDTCNSGDEFFVIDGSSFENYDDCGSAECSVSEEGFYDTGADRIDGNSSRHSSRRRGQKGIFGRHRAKHLARKEELARREYDDERYYEQDQNASYGDRPYDIDDGYGANGDYRAPAVVPIDRGQANGSGVNTTIGVSGLYFNRDYEDNQQFSASRFANERGLFSNDADEDDFGGYDVNLTRRKANGNGFEARYFGLEPSRATATLGGSPFTTLRGGGFFSPSRYLSNITIPNDVLGGGPLNFNGSIANDIVFFPRTTAADVFNYADVHQVTRETSIMNVEFNLLRLGRTGQRNRGAGRSVSHEYLAGFRYFKFDESFGYNAQAFRQGTIASNLSRAEYLNEVTNSLYGAQIGGRTEIGFLRKFSLIIGTKAGIYNNRFTNDQDVTLHPRGENAYKAFDYEGEDSEITMLGELDLGVTYRMFSNTRLRVGYRALFVSDVAFAVPQIEQLSSNFNAVQNPTANDDLFLHGGYFGAEFAF